MNCTAKTQSLQKRGYQLLDQAGEGAFSKVYRVRRTADGLMCACKVSRERIQWERECALLQEVDCLSQCIFPTIYDYWEEAGVCYLMMEYIAGQSLRELMRRRGRLSRRQTVEIGRRLAEGLAFLEEREGILYRDLKPENVRIGQGGQVKLIDFGCICPLTEVGKPGLEEFGYAGTPGYAAPEQLTGIGTVGAYSDVYSLGRLLHYMITGDDPCLPPIDKPPIRAYDRGLDRAFEQLLEECVRRERKERPPDMRRVLQRLRHLEEKSSLRYIWAELCAACRRRSRSEYLFEKNIIRVKSNPLFRR